MINPERETEAFQHFCVGKSYPLAELRLLATVMNSELTFDDGTVTVQNHKVNASFSQSKYHYVCQYIMKVV